MSLKYRDSQGNETPVAGLNGTSGKLVPSVALAQSGTAWFEAISAGAYVLKQVTFDTPMPDTDYTVVVENNEYRYTVFLESKTVNGFNIGVGNVTDEASIARGLKWTAFKLMTDTVHEADSTHIAQNTANFAPAFSEVTSYAVGDYVTYKSILYRCTTAHTAGVWVAGHFTQVTVGGDMASINSKIPSTASSTGKLAYVEYVPDTSLYSNWEELLELLHQKGGGWWTGTIYIGKWYTYTARIVLGSSGYWYGSFLAKGAENEDLVGASKTYDTTDTWTVTHYATASAFSKARIANGLKANANTFTANVSSWLTQGVARLTVTDSRNAEIWAMYFARVFNGTIIALYPVITEHRASLTLDGNLITYNDSAGISTTNDGRVYLEVIENDC